MKDVTESPFWVNLFDSFMKSIDWKSNHYIFRFYIGFDKADAIYDTGMDYIVLILSFLLFFR